MSNTLLNAICPVCGTGCNENANQCNSCGFEDKLGIASLWADAEDAREWRKTVVKPLRMEWQLKVLREQQSEFSEQMLKAIKFMDSKINVLFEKQEKFVSKEDLRSLDDKLNNLVASGHKQDLTQSAPIAPPPHITVPQEIRGRVDVAPRIGSIMRFGRYDWRVLDVQNGQALLLSDKVIESRRYHSDDVATTWAECELRGYLNGAFYNSFGQEKSRIVETPISNPSNLWYGTDGGSSTRDNVFLLSIEEVDKYFGNSGDYVNKRRKEYEGNYPNGKWVAAAGGWAFSNENDNSRIATDASGKACWWWLRSPGNYGIAAAGVTDVGSVYVRGLRVSFASGGVRPALWLNL